MAEQRESSKNRGWQVGRSLADRMYHMLTNQVDCDVTFVFPHTEHATKISAHKLVLKAGSPVFEAMFSGNFEETRDKNVKIVDIVPSVFHDMLRYFYTDDADITPNNVLPLMSAAKKYMIDGLTVICTRFVAKNMNEENVCKILNDSLVYGDEPLAQKCCEFIGSKAEFVIKTTGFKDLSQDALRTLLEYDDLVVNEMLLYDACLNWARKQQTKGSPSDLDIRETLGDCLYQIRFHSMICDDFAMKIGEANDILTSEEKRHFYGYLIAKSAKAKQRLTEMGFNMEARQKSIKFPCSSIARPVRFGLDGNKEETISFSHTSGSRVQLRGISVYGGQNAGEIHEIRIDLTETFASGSGVGQQPAGTLETIIKKIVSTGNSEPIEMELHQRHELMPNKQYTITVRSEGPATYCAQRLAGAKYAQGGVSLMFTEGFGTKQMDTRMVELLLLTC